METLWQDLDYGFRMLFKNPRFTAVAVLSLAIGIGATSAIFSVANALTVSSLALQKFGSPGDSLEPLARTECRAGLVLTRTVSRYSRGEPGLR